ncbi:MAG TPA: apolipoprotein N-acyltransferase [Chthonomonadales bacterium]|nr:apolipoprotein N-acyltransferase [Chthonomonadales bacterium]
MRYWGICAAAASGLLLWAASPQFNLWPLAWLALIPLFLSIWSAKSMRAAFGRAYLFGWFYLAPLWYWIALTINHWAQMTGGAGSEVGWIAWAVLTAPAAAFYGVWGAIAWRLNRRLPMAWSAAACAAAWVAVEWLRDYGSFSMPWGQLSYSQFRFLPLIQIAAVTGAYGVSFLVALVNATLAGWWRAGRARAAAGPAGAAIAVVGLIAARGAAGLRAQASPAAVTVADMQTNFSMENDLSESQQLRIMEQLTRAASVSSPPPDLYVWSETSAPEDALHSYTTRSAMVHLADKYDADVLVGTQIKDPSSGARSNSSLLFLPGGGPPQRYDKQQLVPFGEYIPFRSYWPQAIADLFHFFPTDDVSGTGSRVLHGVSRNGVPIAIGPYICWESMYPRYARAMALSGANLLATQSNDAWFGSVEAMRQHVSAVALRAVECRRDTVRSTTNGITCLVSATGRITARAPLNQATYLARRVHLRSGETPYVRYGDWFVALCALAVAGGIALPASASRKAGPTGAGRCSAPDRAPEPADEASRNGAGTEVEIG